MFRFFRDFFIYGVASVLGKIAAIFLMPIYTSILTKEEYGAMALITSIGGILDLVSNFNIHSGIARDYYEEGINRRKLVSTGFFSILSMSLFVLAIMYIGRRYWSIEVLGLDEKYLLSFTVFLFTAPVGSLQSYFAILTRYKKKAVEYSIGTIIILIIQLATSIYGVVVLRFGIISVFISFFIANVLGVLYFAILNRDLIRIQFDTSILKKALLFSVPTMPAILAGWIDNSLGQVLIGRNVSMSELGVYSIAISFSSIFTLISIAFQNVWSPFLFENYRKADFKNNINKLFTIISCILIIISVLLSLFSQELVLLLSNEGYLSACKYVTLLCIPMCFYLLLPFASSGVSISRDTKYIGISYMAGSMMNVIMLFLLIHKMGVVAVPLCLAVSRIMSYFILYKVSEKKIEFELPNFLLVLLITFVTICYVVVLLNIPLLVRVIISVVLISSLLIVIEKNYGFQTIFKMVLKKDVKR